MGPLPPCWTFFANSNLNPPNLDRLSYIFSNFALAKNGNVGVKSVRFGERNGGAIFVNKKGEPFLNLKGGANFDPKRGIHF